MCISVLRVATGPRKKLASCKSALTPLTPPPAPPPPSAVCSLLLCGLFYEAICCMSFHVSFCSCVFSPFSIALNSLGKERANLRAFRMFVRFVLIWICRFPLPLGVWEGLRFVIVTLPGLFSYLFFYSTDRSKAVVPLIVLLFVALWFILRGDLFKSYLVSFCSCVFQSF